MKILLVIFVVCVAALLLWRLVKSKPLEIADTADKEETEFVVIEADKNPWGVPVVDLRPFTHTVLATTTNSECADNALSYGGETGELFLQNLPDFESQIECELRYSLGTADRLLPGVLFTPSSMDEKWAVFCDETRIIFVRSWLREVAAIATYHCKDSEIIITELQGGFATGSEGEMLKAELDYLIRTYVLGEEYPVPMEEITTSEALGFVCFSTWGNKAGFAAKHPIPYKKPESIIASNSLLHIALAQNDKDRVVKLLESGFPIDGLAQDGLTTLHWASVAKTEDMVNLMLGKGCPIDARTREGATLLMNEAQDGDVKKMKFYLSKGADPNAKDLRGFTALHRCSEMGREDLVAILLEAGADPNARAEGNTPISLAAARGNQEIVKLLRQNESGTE